VLCLRDHPAGHYKGGLDAHRLRSAGSLRKSGISNQGAMANRMLHDDLNIKAAYLFDVEKIPDSRTPPAPPKLVAIASDVVRDRSFVRMPVCSGSARRYDGHRRLPGRLDHCVHINFCNVTTGIRERAHRHWSVANVAPWRQFGRCIGVTLNFSPSLFGPIE
jgi:hypothetical protein